MKTIAITYGDGEYLLWVRRMAAHFERLNDIPTLVIPPADCPEGLPHPAWIKAWIWDFVPHDVDRIIWLDGDVVPMKSIVDLLPGDDIAFAAVEDIAPSVADARKTYPPARGFAHYYNAGVFVVTRELQQGFEAFKEMRHKPEILYAEQSYLNQIVHDLVPKEKQMTLPTMANHFHGSFYCGIRMWHLAGWHEPTKSEVLYAMACALYPEEADTRGGIAWG